ncbi:COPII coat assembly protein [Lachnellula occidentalis]|uniref:Protein transport protein sec16 n=1 Tax=Lachnellula occidentalis TaxID=215460 RepID=A0A8H8RMI8_9HELO|nr:COPII coat assembly protein [Lachnellula occidentalis]
MSSEPSSVSWHPAFMPNSSADIIHTEPILESHSSTFPTEHAILEDSKPDSSMNPSKIDTQELPADALEDSEPIPGNTAHPELPNLRDALATSLASPGGVEMDESPLHNGITMPETAEEDKADFPSEAPSNESKHLSTMSFARTAQEVNWGEDDEVDPEWNLSRADTDPFKLMAKTDRTNSFPQVPPAHSSGINHDEERLPQSQAEEIMNEVQQESRDLFGDEVHDGEDDFFAQQGTSQHELFPEPHHERTDESVQTDFGQTYGGDFMQGGEEDQARYEEGIPLVQPAEGESADRAPPAFMDGDEGDEDFFAKVSKSEPAPDQSLSEPPTLERKSTMQVMDSLHFQPHQQTHPDITEDTTEASQSSLDRATGGGVAVSTSTIISQVLGDPEAPIHSLGMDSGDGDLAEKWKAALAGDEFLDDDDEFLADDEPAEKDPALDPAALFGSDDEGFLEDTDDQDTESNTFNQMSPPIPAPVTSPNGHVVGFDSLTGAAQPRPQPRPTSSSSSRYLPAGTNTAAPLPINSYAPAGPMLTDLSRPGLTTSLSSPYISPATSSFPPQQQPQRPEMSKAQSFANQSKGGYSSPYDLPMEVMKPRKRVSMQQINHGYNAPAASVPPPRSISIPPPRSTSIYTQPDLPQSRRSGSSLSPPQSSHSAQESRSQPPAGPSSAQPPKTIKKEASGFFEELPMSSRPKPAPRHSTGYGSPAMPGQASAPPQFPGQAAQPLYSPPAQQQLAQGPPAPQGLVAPERVSPYASLTTAPVPPPSMASRYSPAPPQLQAHTAPPALSRYSPAPPIQRQQSQPYNAPPVNAAPPPILAHQPRTSSPLAHFERSQEPRYRSDPSLDRRSSSSGYDSSMRAHHLSPTREVDESEQSTASQNQHHGSLSQPTLSRPPQNMRPTSTPPPPPAMQLASPPKRAPSNYLPQQGLATTPPQTFTPPQRSQTQSPGQTFAGPRHEMPPSAPYQRPASVEIPTSPKAQAGPAMQPIFPPSRARGFSQALNYIAPTDGREDDPMQRWRGAPIFVWGAGGTIFTSFPKDVPRYGMNQSVPMIIRSPGEVKTRNIKDINPLAQRMTSFPGPLKGKSKKKDVAAWLTAGIEMLEQNASYLRTATHLSHEDKRTEERIILWKILRVFIENDGVLEGNPVVEKAVRAVLSPGLDDENTAETPLYATGADLSGITHYSNSGTRADPVDAYAVDQLRKHLLRGEREKAVWEAVDKRLWAHAMLISNTVSKDLYKQVAQEFVQKEVKNIGENTESLAALYEVFAGNFEESIDELVPPSARAGFQMVSTSDATGPSKDALDGLDRWRETLGLVLSNRSADDNQALNSLGKLLSGYGRAEAAHICFLFARSISIFGGIDDPSVNIVLVGSDHLKQPYEFDKEMEPILLSEVFEYGMSLSSVSNVAASSPHLSIYKMQHATLLAEYGYREKALQYCESIAASITSQTRRSPYHHALLVSALDDLSKRLKQSPREETTGWISKPSIDKVSGSLGSLFNKFVAGDEDKEGAGSINAGSGTESGPFARIAGGTPTISRSPSTADIYGSYNGGLGINGTGIPVPTTRASSKYAPNRTFTPEPLTGSSYGSRPRSSLEESSSSEHRRYEPQRQMSQMSDYRPNSQPAANHYAPQANTGYAPESAYAPSSGSPYAPQQSTRITEQPPSNIYSSPQPLNNFGEILTGNSYAPVEPSPQQQSGYEPSNSSGYEPAASSGYEPPSGGYEPPSSSYQPYEEPDSPVGTENKKKSFMDDDGDVPRASASQEKTKAEKDREADEAFRKAAEADAQKSSAAPAKKGWGLGGWFAKKEPQQEISQPGKPIRAKLGEASSFVYDPDLKRWINKKGGDVAPTPTATPPPPRAVGPPRTASVPPGNGHTSAPRAIPTAMRAASDYSGGPMGNSLTPSDGLPPSSLGTETLAPPPLMRSVSNGSAAGGPPSAPPSRPSTSMSNASDIDDLLGPATGGSRKGTTRKKKGRGSNYYMKLARPAMRQCLSRPPKGSSWTTHLPSPLFHRLPPLNHHCAFSSTPTHHQHAGSRSSLPPKTKTKWLKLGCILAIPVLSYILYINVFPSTPKIFDPPRFTPFSIIRREQVSATSILLTLRPRDARGVECKDPYGEFWGKGTWSVEVKQPELQIARAYTPLPPLEGGGKGGGGDLRFLIRREHRGEVSRYLHGLQVGAQVELRGPKIEAELPAEVSDVVFLAGGTGIAPALQVVYTLLERRKGDMDKLPKIRIVWANRKREDCVGGGHGTDRNTLTGKGNENAAPGYMVRELQNLQDKYPDNLQVQYVVDEEGTVLDQKRIAPLLNPTQSDAKTVKYSPITTRIDSKLLFVSGPEGFVEYLAGPKKWEGGKEGQGELGGVLRRMGIRDWKVWKL